MRVRRNQVPAHATKLALEHILSLPKEQLDWPVHRWHPQVLQLLAYLPPQKGELCEPQIVWDYPTRQPKSDGYHMHRDQPPEWADNRKYVNILGVALTHSGPHNGGVLFNMEGGVFQPSMLAGDVVEFCNELHVTGVFRKGVDRINVYFRFLEPPTDKSWDFQTVGGVRYDRAI